MSGKYTPLDISEFIDKIGDPEKLVRPAQIKYEYKEYEDENTAYKTHIFEASSGPKSFSTSTELAVIPKFIWDSNRYYRDLGLVWPYQGVTRKKLRRAYQRRKGYSSNRMTYCFKQLLRVKEEYDALPLGVRLEDDYTRYELMMQLAPLAAAESAERGELTTANDLVREFDEANPVLDIEQGQSLDSSWDWGFFLLGSRKYDTTDLELWQGFLIEATGHEVHRLAVGYCDDQAGVDYAIRDHQGMTVVFLNENTTPTLDKAVEAIADLLVRQTKEISS